MACRPWLDAKGISEEKLRTETDFPGLLSRIYSEGVDCINRNQSFCEVVCASSTKNQEACFACLSNPQSCVTDAGDCRGRYTDCTKNPNSPCCNVREGSCCPYVKAAVACGACLAKQGNAATVDSFLQCYQEPGLSSTTTIIIAVTCSVLGVLLIVAIAVIWRVRSNAAARDRLVNRLEAQGVNKNVVNQIANLDYSSINSDIYRTVNQDFALSGKTGPATSSVARLSPTDFQDQSLGLEV